MNQQNGSRSTKGSEQKVVQLHVNVSSPGRVNSLIKENHRNLRDMGLNFLPTVRQRKKTSEIGIQTDGQPVAQRTPQKSQKVEEIPEPVLERKQSALNADPWDLEQVDQVDKQQCLQFLPAGDLEERLSNDIKQFYAQIEQYNQKNKSLFDKLIQKISKLATETVKGATVEVFGSFATELCLPNSDIDLVIKLPSTANYYPPDVLRNLESKCQESQIVEETKCLTSASMPVLKVKCCKRFLSKRLDISIQDNKHNGIACVSLVRDFLAIYEHLKPLVLVFKYFLQKCSLADTYQGGLSSYGLILMIVSFFQSKLYTRPSPSLGQLMLEFLQLYGMEMDYCGKTIYVHLPNQSPEFLPIYFDAQNFVFCQIQTLVIADPLNKANNVGRPTYLIQRLKFSFANSFIQLLTGQSKEPLKQFFSCAQNTSLSLQSNVISMYKPIIDVMRRNTQLIIQPNF